MSASGTVAPIGAIRARGFRYRRRWNWPGGDRVTMLITLGLALAMTFVGVFTFVSRLTPKTADLPSVASAPVSIAPRAALVPAPQLPSGDTVSQPRTAPTLHVVRARAAAIRVTPAAPKVVTAPKPASAPAPSSPTPTSSCGTVASLTEPVTTLLPSPLGGSSGVVQTVTCSLP